MMKLTLGLLVGLCALVPDAALAQSALDEMSAQIVESGSFAPGEGGRPTITLEDLREVQSQPVPTGQPPSTQSGSSSPPDVWGNASSGISQTLNTDRLIDPVTGSIDRAIGGVTGSINNGIDRALSGILSPVDAAIDRTLGGVNSAIDQAIANVMAPVDQVINNVMAGIDQEINRLLDGFFGSAEEAVGGVIDEATGGLLGGILGGANGSRSVEKFYNPISPMASIVSAASFQSMLPGVTAPFTESIPFEVGSMGLPDYSNITPVIDLLAQGENGNPNQTLQGADRFSTNPLTLTSSIANEVERLGSRSIANATLSKAGQDEMKSSLEGAAKTLDTAVQIADESQDLDVTQDVMKNLSAQLAQDSVIRAGQYQQGMLARQQAAADAVVNTEISRLLDEQARARRSQWLGDAARIHMTAGQMHLPGEASRDDRS
jgi:hypothetical protein